MTASTEYPPTYTISATTHPSGIYHLSEWHEETEIMAPLCGNGRPQRTTAFHQPKPIVEALAGFMEEVGDWGRCKKCQSKAMRLTRVYR